MQTPQRFVDLKLRGVSVEHVSGDLQFGQPPVSSHPERRTNPIRVLVAGPLFKYPRGGAFAVIPKRQGGA